MGELGFGQLLYRSQATRPFSQSALKSLLLQAQARNATESLTGLLIYDSGHFWQWLEGPSSALQRVWASIARDPRHARVERLDTPWRQTRMFPDWRMQIATAGVVAAKDGWSLDPATVQQLHSGKAPALAIVNRIGLENWLSTPDQLALLLARGQPPALDKLRERLSDTQPMLEAVWSCLIQPASRALGEAWKLDALDSTDLVIAHGRLLQLLHAAVKDLPPVPKAHVGSALVAPLPGEPELSGTSFAGLALLAQGWQVECPFPSHAQALLDELAVHPYDVLHLSISDAFEREHRLPELAALIRAARRASANPRTLVLVSGRAFSEQAGLCTLVGADGNGLSQGSTLADLNAMATWASARPHSLGAMVAQATLNDVVLNIQRSRFGIPEELPHPTVM